MPYYPQGTGIVQEDLDETMATHEAMATVHQDAPALIDADVAVHAALATVHQDASAIAAAGIAVHDADVSAHGLEGPLSPMLLTGGVISEGTVGTITVSALTALLRTGTGTTDPLAHVALAEQANVALDAADTLYRIGLQYDAENPATPVLLLQEANFNRTSEIGLGICMKDTSDPVEIHFQNAGMRLQDGVSKLQRRATSLRASELASGCTISDAGGASLQFHVAKGIVYHGIVRLTPFADAPYNPFISGDDKFTYVFGDSVNGWTFTEDSTVIDNLQYYDGAGALATLTTLKYSCHWVYLHPDDNHIYVVYSTTNAKLAEAEQAPAPSDLPDVIDNFGMLLGCIILQKSATAFTTIQMVTDTFFTGTAVADHSALESLDEDDHPQYTLKSLFDAYTLLMATVDNTPIALTVGASRIVGRKSTGTIVALTGAELMAILSGQAGADFSMNTHKITGVVDPTSDQHAATKKYHDDNLPAGGYTEGARVYHNANQEVADATAWVTLSFNSEEYDTDTMHDNATNNSRITIKTAGKYLVVLQMKWEANVTGRRIIGLRVNGADLVAFDERPIPGNSTFNMTLSTVLDLSITDYIEAICYQNSGGVLDALYNVGANVYFIAQRIG